MSNIDLVTPYQEFFKIIPADSPRLRDEVYRLRYEVYCRELGWERPEDFSDGREYDEFDEHATHCLLLHRRTGTYAGTVRLVPSATDGAAARLPMDKHYDRRRLYSGAFPGKLHPGSCGEISRLALRREFRRRKGEGETPEGQGVELFQWTPDERRRFPNIALGLYLAAATVGLAKGLQGVVAMMEPRLARHLRYGGICFEQVGEAVDFRGLRAPFYISRDELFEHLNTPLRNLLHAIAEELDISI